MRVVVILNLSDPYNRLVLPGAVEYAKLRGWELVLQDAGKQEWLEPAIRHADALLLGVHDYEWDPLVTRTQLPAVSWSGSLVEVNWRRVMTDDLAVGRAAADHLMARGFRNFAFYNDSPDIWAMRRRDGFLGRVEAAGWQPSDIPRPLSLQSSELAASIKSLPTPLGVMLAHDQGAVAMMSACREAGLRIPEDVAIVGVNNDALFCEICDPPLSTIPLQTHQIGYEAAALLGRLLDRSPLPPWSILIPPADVVIRRSSDTLATSDQLVIEAVQFIKDHLAGGVGTKEVAAQMSVSRTTLDARFVAAIGRSVAEEIRRERLEKVRQLLAGTDLPMPEIARRAGFSSARQLSESFHHFVGQTPTAYRRHVSAMSR